MHDVLLTRQLNLVNLRCATATYETRTAIWLLVSTVSHGTTRVGKRGWKVRGMMLTVRRLWDTIRNYEQSIPIAQFAEEHFKRHGRPLRIAIDEPDWRFNNVTRQQVYAIRESTYPNLSDVHQN